MISNCKNVCVPLWQAMVCHITKRKDVSSKELPSFHSWCSVRFGEEKPIDGQQDIVPINFPFPLKEEVAYAGQRSLGSVCVFINILPDNPHRRVVSWLSQVKNVSHH